MPDPATEKPNDKLLTPAEFAEWVGGKATEAWAKEQAMRKKIPAFKIGGYWRFHIPTVLEHAKNFRRAA